METVTFSGTTRREFFQTLDVQNIAEEVHLLTSLVQPDPETGTVYTSLPMTGVLLEQVELVSHYEHTGKEQKSLCYHVRAVAQQVCAPNC